MKSGKEIVDDLFLQVVHKKVRNVQLGHGSFITMDFGKDVLVEVKTNRGIHTFNRGEWHLWIYMTAWRLDQGDIPIIGAADDRMEIEKKITILENNELLSVSIKNSSFDVLMEFENNLSLLLFSFGVTEYEQWMLFTPERKVFTAGPGISWTYENSSKPDHEKRIS